ncbi:MAG: hypothetical protein ACW98I_17220 [Candidatus Hodarchaeales archaeon]|jgi:hypothetical protein
MERVEFFKKQIQLEKDIVASAHAAVKDIKNRMVKELIEGIASDSTKHASLLNSLLAAESGANPLIDEKVTDQLKENLENHIRLEQQAIDTCIFSMMKFDTTLFSKRFIRWLLKKKPLLSRISGISLGRTLFLMVLLEDNFYSFFLFFSFV